jgi:C1A family cysteine protease
MAAKEWNVSHSFCIVGYTDISTRLPETAGMVRIAGNTS